MTSNEICCHKAAHIEEGEKNGHRKGTVQVIKNRSSKNSRTSIPPKAMLSTCLPLYLKKQYFSWQNDNREVPSNLDITDFRGAVGQPPSVASPLRPRPLPRQRAALHQPSKV